MLLFSCILRRVRMLATRYNTSCGRVTEPILPVPRPCPSESHESSGQLRCLVEGPFKMPCRGRFGTVELTADNANMRY